MTKMILFGDEGREKVFAGIEKLTKAVSATLGARGRNAIIARTPPLITNDGVTIAREISFSDPFEDLGAQTIKEAAEKTNKDCGDGTSTSTILAHAIIKEGMKEKANPILLRAGIEKAVKAVVEELKKISKPVTTSKEIAQVGAISSGSEEVGKVIADMMEKITTEGNITIEPSR